MAQNGINNFKGVMLCSRPNENPGPIKKDIFCARVVPPEHLGLVPTKKYDEIKVRKKVNPVLNKHKRWLEEFKNKISSAKEQQQEAMAKEAERQQKIREQAERERERVRLGVSEISQGNTNGNTQPTEPAKEEAPAVKQTAEPKKHHQPKGNEKPAWAQTQQEIDQKEQQEADELLNFFNNTDIEKFIDEVEVNALLSTLKNKIEDIKKDKDWRQNNRKKLKEQQPKPEKADQEDTKTEVSKGSVAKSVASEKSTQRIEELKEKLEKKKEGQDEWDRNTRTSKQSFVNIEQRIAKNVADDLLRNYGNLKAVHSNVSVRKLLEREAARQLAQSTVGPDNAK